MVDICSVLNEQLTYFFMAFLTCNCERGGIVLSDLMHDDKLDLVRYMVSHYTMLCSSSTL